jgi:hypothetical protein
MPIFIFRDLKNFYQKLNIKDIYLEFKDHITDFLNEKKELFRSNENSNYIGKKNFKIKFIFIFIKYSNHIFRKTTDKKLGTKSWKISLLLP